jgi:Mg-chelatase subunit ChlI/Mg-chelatase subunit ChlD
VLTRAQIRDLRPVYPFPAITGQWKAKKALILNAVDPTIGGVLISGPKGSGKSFLVKALSKILPMIERVGGCSFNCSPSDPTNMCPRCLSLYQAGEKLPIEKVPMKIIQVPLSVTDDMLVGSIDLDRAFEEGVKALRPGLMAEANQNILYIDEVNLLPDHITDSILDAAASGWNIVEREGISVQHPSRFILVGTMNPEEGELRPQILDRFGVFAETKTVDDPDLRVLILKRSEMYSSDPLGFSARFKAEVEKLRTKIEEARMILIEVESPPEVLTMISEVCSKLKVDGFRPDIVAARVMMAFAALRGEKVTTHRDIPLSMELSLGHRTRRSGMASPPSPDEIKDAVEDAEKKVLKFSSSNRIPFIEDGVSVPREFLEILKKKVLRNTLVSFVMFCLFTVTMTYFVETVRSIISPAPLSIWVLLLEFLFSGAVSYFLAHVVQRQKRDEEPTTVVGFTEVSLDGAKSFQPKGEQFIGGVGASGVSKVIYEVDTTSPDLGIKILDEMDDLETTFTKAIPTRRERPLRGGGNNRGQRKKAVSSSSRGRAAWYQVPKGKPRDIALVPTIREAALHQSEGEGHRVKIRPEDIREKVREYRTPYCIVILVDMSMSMIESFENIFESIYNLHKDVYRKRDRVGLVVFKGSKAYIIQHPTANLDLVVEKLRGVGASDFTPLASGLQLSWKVLKQEKLRNRDSVAHLIVISDGIVNVPLSAPLSPLTRRRYTSEAQADAFDVARLLAKEKFCVHVVNTKHSQRDADSMPSLDTGMRLRLSPTQFLMELARVSKGNYEGLTSKKIQVA